MKKSSKRRGSGECAFLQAVMVRDRALQVVRLWRSAIGHCLHVADASGLTCLAFRASIRQTPVLSAPLYLVGHRVGLPLRHSHSLSRALPKPLFLSQNLYFNNIPLTLTLLIATPAISLNSQHLPTPPVAHASSSTPSFRTVVRLYSGAVGLLGLPVRFMFL